MKQKAIVTGGVGQIGRAIVHKLLSSEIAVVIVDTDPHGEAFADECCQQFGEKAAAFVQTDIGDHGQVKQMIQDAVAEGDDLKYLVNNAVYSVYEPFLEITEESWERVIRVGLTGYFYCSQAFAKQMVHAQRSGSIVNVASINSFAVERNIAHYATAKGGILQLTRAMAVDLAPYSITVNAVAPGLTLTDKNKDLHQSEPFASQIKRIPLQRAGRTDEIANVVHFLLTAEHYMNGQTLLADGGLLSSIS